MRAISWPIPLGGSHDRDNHGGFCSAALAELNLLLPVAEEMLSGHSACVEEAAVFGTVFAALKDVTAPFRLGGAVTTSFASSGPVLICLGQPL